MPGTALLVKCTKPDLAVVIVMLGCTLFQQVSNKWLTIIVYSGLGYMKLAEKAS